MWCIQSKREALQYKMPSLFSRFKHRKTPSQSSADLNSPPTSPSTAQSPTAAVAGYSATPASPSQARQTSGSGPLVHRSDEDVVVVDRGAPPFSFRQQQPDPIAARDAPPGTTPPYRADPTGHSRAFADESERPELPTTSSNVNNPIPSGARTPVSKDLPELPQLPRDLSAPFSGFPLPPGAAPASPTPPPPAIPHVSSVDRSRFINAESERPKPIVAASQGLQEDERGDVGGQFGHVKSIPNVKHGWRSQDTNRSRRSIDAKNNPYRMNESEGDRLTPATVENQGRRDVTNGYEGRKSDETRRSRKNLDDQAIPARGVSLVANPPLATGTSENATAQAAIAQTAPTSPRESLRSHWGNHVDGDEFINQHIANLFLNDRAGQQYEPKTTPGLETAREDMTAAVITSSRAPSAPLCEAGRQAFIAVGMGDKIGITNTVDVRTQWIEPVVQVGFGIVDETQADLVEGNRTEDRTH